MVSELGPDDCLIWHTKAPNVEAAYRLIDVLGNEHQWLSVGSQCAQWIMMKTSHR